MMGYVLKKTINPEEDSRCGLVLLQTPTAISIGRSSHGNSRGSWLGPKNCTEHLTPINKRTFKIVSAGIALSAILAQSQSHSLLAIKPWTGFVFLETRHRAVSHSAYCFLSTHFPFLFCGWGYLIHRFAKWPAAVKELKTNGYLMSPSGVEKLKSLSIWESCSCFLNTKFLSLLTAKLILKY